VLKNPLIKKGTVIYTYLEHGEGYSFYDRGDKLRGLILGKKYFVEFNDINELKTIKLLYE
jgi:hypothetical protein